jgi:nucleoside phosphorylase
MIALIFATDREANPFLQKAGLTTADCVGQTVFNLRPGKQIVVCICGMGQKAALDNTRRLLCEYQVDSVINAGIAGAVTEKMRKCDIFRITSVSTWPVCSNVYRCNPDFGLDLHPASLATVEKPIFDPVLRQRIATVADLVDMEGAFIAQACLEKDIPVHAIKGVSDMAGEGDRKTLYDNIDKVSATIADIIWKELTRASLTIQELTTKNTHEHKEHKI